MRKILEQAFRKFLNFSIGHAHRFVLWYPCAVEGRVVQHERGSGATLPRVLTRAFGAGFPAVLGSARTPQNRRYRGLRYGWKALRAYIHASYVGQERAESYLNKIRKFYENSLKIFLFIRS
jgi:hypothetical protein